MKFLKFLLFEVICLYSSVSGGQTIKEDKIVGGIEVDIEDAPWQVSLHYNNLHRCGGFIIGNDWILTAGHCT